MAGRQWWSMPSGPERQAAKEAYYASRPELPDVPRGRAPAEFEADGRKGFVGTAGFHWPYATDLEKRAARLAAQSDLRPSPLIQVVEDGGAVHLVGRSGWRYPADVSSPRLFKVFYSAAVQAEMIVNERAANKPAADKRTAGQP
jgi:hypothetical protein